MKKFSTFISKKEMVSLNKEEATKIFQELLIKNPKLVIDFDKFQVSLQSNFPLYMSLELKKQQ